MQIIGFTNKFYTLWNISETSVDFGLGVEHITRYSYVKNISMELDTVRSLYPGVEIDMSLRGHSSFIKSSEKIYDFSLFMYGRHKGTKIEDCTDYSYMQWYRNNGCPDESKEILDSILVKNGYYLVDNNIIDKYDYEKLMNEKEEFNKTLDEIKSGNFSFIPESNLDETGEYCINSGLFLVFPELKEMSYQGYPYYLPVLNGKAKRIKNKKVIITDCTIKKDERFVNVIVNNFEIVK